MTFNEKFSNSILNKHLKEKNMITIEELNCKISNVSRYTLGEYAENRKGLLFLTQKIIKNLQEKNKDSESFYFESGFFLTYCSLINDFNQIIEVYYMFSFLIQVLLNNNKGYQLVDCTEYNNEIGIVEILNTFISDIKHYSFTKDTKCDLNIIQNYINAVILNLKSDMNILEKKVFSFILSSQKK